MLAVMKCLLIELLLDQADCFVRKKAFVVAELNPGSWPEQAAQEQGQLYRDHTPLPMADERFYLCAEDMAQAGQQASFRVVLPKFQTKVHLSSTSSTFTVSGQSPSSSRPETTFPQLR